MIVYIHLVVAVWIIVCSINTELSGASAEEFISKRSREEAAIEYFEQGDLLAIENQKYIDSLPFYRAAVRLAPTVAEYWISLAHAEFHANVTTTLKSRLEKAKLLGYDQQLLDQKYTLYGLTGDVSDEKENASFPSIPVYDSKEPQSWNQPFVFRQFYDEISLASLPFTSITNLRSIYGSQKVEFYPQNMLVRPTRVFKVPFSDALTFLDYPEGAYVACDISNPGTYMQWNVPNQHFQSILAQVESVCQQSISFSDEKQHLWKQLLANGKFDENFLTKFAPGDDDEETLAAARFHWQQLAIDKHWNMLLVGEKDAGMFYHTDSLPVGSWQVQLAGSKQWRICAPDENENEQGDSEKSGDSLPITTTKNCYESVLHAGDLLYYPPYFGHSTQCLDTPTISMSSSVFMADNVRDFHAMKAVMQKRCAPDSKDIRYAPGVCAWFTPVPSSATGSGSHPFDSDEF